MGLDNGGVRHGVDRHLGVRFSELNPLRHDPGGGAMSDSKAVADEVDDLLGSPSQLLGSDNFKVSSGGNGLSVRLNSNHGEAMNTRRRRRIGTKYGLNAVGDRYLIGHGIADG